MKPTVNEAFDVVYRFYPRGVWPDGAGYDQTDERRRQQEAVQQAVAGYDRWRSMLDPLRVRFPVCTVRDRALSLLAGSFLAAYSAEIDLPLVEPSKGVHSLGFHVSILAPYYVIYISRTFLLDDHPTGDKATLPAVRLEIVAEEEPYARELAQEIEATYGYASMAPEIGRVIVPDVATCFRRMGEARIYDCLLSDDWLS